MKKRVVVIIIDSLGVGQMDDYELYRKEDKGANTFKHILDKAYFICIDNLEKLGINNILNHPRLKQINKNSLASYGICKLMHEGADSYMGHQEIAGSRPIKSLVQPFKEVLPKIKIDLEKLGHKVSIINGDKNPCLLVDDYIVLADNIETDYGLIYNITAPLDFISFDKVLKLGKEVRSLVKVSRVIALGGRDINLKNITDAIETTKDGCTGVNCPKSGVYKKGYEVRHLGYGIDPEKQAPSILVKNNIPVTLIGKMADVITCDGATYIEAVETDRVMCETINSFKKLETGAILATVQESDLSGHMQDVNRYATKINTVDAFLTQILDDMTNDDLLIISADHGNDPTIGHSHHTREKTFIISYQKNKPGTNIGERETLSDIGASVCEFFKVSNCENGKAFI